MSVLEAIKNEVEEVVHKAEEVLHPHKEEEVNDIDGISDKYVIYLNREVESDVTGGHTEDKPVYQVTGAVIDYLDQEDELSKFKAFLENSKADAKAYLNRVFTFKKRYTKKEDGLVFFYSKDVSYPPSNLISDLEYELGVERG